MPITVYQYPKCSTCRNAMKWLAAHGIEARAVDIVSAPPSATLIRRLHEQSGLPLAKFFNTSGESYRRGDFKERLKTMSAAEAYQSLAADGKLIKRPLVDAGGTVLVGFDAAAWKTALQG
ncbi:MAG: arsenate reductase family protein [Acidobacteria bacterium]|nr:arsenate reductase family protein [Acidobacteriota bacterium]